MKRLPVWLYFCTGAGTSSPNGNRTQQRTVKIGMQQLQHTIAAEITARVSSKKRKVGFSANVTSSKRLVVRT